MLAEQFNQAAAGARSYSQLEEISRLTWRAHAEGHLADDDAQAVAEVVQARRGALASKGAVSHPKPPFGRPRAAPRSPDRQASLERRRRQAMSGVVPAQIAAHFTMAELAVLTVIAREVQKGGVCCLPIDAIAALAGVSRTSVQNALRAARRLGLLEVKERRRRGLPSLTNVIKVISKDWSAWLKLSGRWEGFKTLSPTYNYFSSLRDNVEKPRERQGPPWRPLSRSAIVPICQGNGRSRATI